MMDKTLETVPRSWASTAQSAREALAKAQKEKTPEAYAALQQAYAVNFEAQRRETSLFAPSECDGSDDCACSECQDHGEGY